MKCNTVSPNELLNMPAEHEGYYHSRQAADQDTLSKQARLARRRPTTEDDCLAAEQQCRTCPPRSEEQVMPTVDRRRRALPLDAACPPQTLNWPQAAGVNGNHDTENDEGPRTKWPS